MANQNEENEISTNENVILTQHFRSLSVLDSMSDAVSDNSSIISTISTIKISKHEQLRFDGMIGDSENESGNSICESTLNTEFRESPSVPKNKENVIDVTATKKLHEKDNQEVIGVKLLSSAKRRINYNDCEPAPNPNLSLENISGLTSFLNITGLTENEPFSISFPEDLKADQDILMEGEDFSASDGSDFDPYSAYTTENCITEDEYYDDPIVKRNRKHLKNKCEKLQDEMEKATEEKTLSPEKKTEDCERIDKTPKCIKTKGKRIWNRRNACFYCQELVTNFSRHLLRRHANEIEVIKYKSINDKDPKVKKLKRQQITDSLRNRGNFIHNSKVCFDRDGASTMLPSKRYNQASSSPSSFATCKNCLGTFKRLSFFRHFRKCGADLLSTRKNQLQSHKNRVLYSHSITIIPNTAQASTELKEKILPHLRSDEISLVVKNDPLIVSYGTRLLKKKKERRSRKAICSKMRDLASLLVIMRKKDATIETFSDAFDPEKYGIFIDSIKTMCRFDEETGTVGITSIPARLRPAVLGCVDILYTQSIMSTESTAYKEAYKKKLDDFKLLIEMNWQWEISSNAEKTRKRINMTKENVLPLDEDIATVMQKIHKLEIKYANELRKDQNVLNYESLCTVTIAHIIMLDRKRAGDVAEAELSFYINRKNEEIPAKVLETLTSLQQKTIKDLDVFQIPGKRTRSVPILLTKTMRENIDLIIACREDMNIPKSNPYLFARPLTNEPFNGGKCLDKIKKQCNLKKPEMLTSTGMRHHIATMSQIHAKQNDQYTEHLAGFLGHDVAVHAKNYRLPLQVLQKAVVGTQLIEYEKLPQEKQKKIETVTSQTINKKCKYLPLGDETNDETKLTEYEKLLQAKGKNIETVTSQSVDNRRKTLSSSDETDDNDHKGLIKKRQTRERTSKIKAKKKKSKVFTSSETEEDDEPLQKRKKSHTKWSDEEVKVVKKHFGKYIAKKINPGKAKCMEVLQKESVLQNRTWMQLNTYVNNIYKKK